MRSSEKSLREQCDAPPDGTLRFIPTGEVIADADLSRWKMEKALDEAMKATNLDPKDAVSFLLLGRVYLLTEKPDALSKAIEAFSTARDLKPDSIEPAAMLGDTLYQANHLTEAEGTLVAACKIPIESGQEYWGNRAWASLGRVSNRVRKYDQAAQAFEKAVGYRSTDAISYFGWATALFHLNRFQEAKEKLQQAKQLAPWLPGTDELEQSLDKAMAASTPAPS
jgi:tetratricopeptide (TPR) repeat protein